MSDGDAIMARTGRPAFLVASARAPWFIGSSIAEALLAKGERVRILDDFSTGRRSNLEALKGNVEVVEGTIVDPEVVTRCMQGVEVVFHQAAIPSVPRSVENPPMSMLANQYAR